MSVKKWALCSALIISMGALDASAQTLSQTVTTGQSSDWALFGSNDGNTWEPAVSGRAYVTYRIELTDRASPDAGTPDSGGGGGGGGLPGYSGGTCPSLVFASSNSSAGDNNFLSAGITRRVRLIRSGTAPRPAVIFTFHPRASTPEWGINDLGLMSGNSGNFIIVAPSVVGNGNLVAGREVWNWDAAPGANADLTLFTDLLVCVDRQVGVNLDRVSVGGFSAGGLFASYLLMHRSEWISTAAIFSGGLLDSRLYQPPVSQAPAMIVWGGTSDTFYRWGQFVDPIYESAQYTHSFHLGALDFSNRLNGRGHLVVRCNHGGGHSPGPVSNDPSRGGYPWPQNWPFRWLYDHVRGQPSPYATSFPAGTMPGVCVRQ